MHVSVVELKSLRPGYSATRNTLKPLSFLTSGYLKVGMKLTPHTLESLGMPRSESYEVRIAWRYLGWLDQDDCITDRCGQLAFAASEEVFRDALIACLRDSYSTIFEEVDITHANQHVLKDIFTRSAFEPASMRMKMLSLFCGLCRRAGLLADEAVSFEVPTKSSSETPPLSSQEQKALDDIVEGNPPMVEPPLLPQQLNGSVSVSEDTQAQELNALLTTLLNLPQSPGWTEELRPWLRQGASHVAQLILQALSAHQGGRQR